MFDVIVVGAGPAGSTAAKALADLGCRVLLAERFAMPRYKSCSGQLIKKSLDRMGARKTVILKNYYFAASV